MIDDHDRGLAFDLERLMSRRRALGLLAAGMGSAALAACGSSPKPSSNGSPPASAGAKAAEIPDETSGPFPGDGSNGPDALTESGVVRSDITKSFGGASGVAGGVPTTLEMKLLDVAAGGRPRAGAAVYVWHCTMDGEYSLYEGSVAHENFLRGVQPADGNGNVSFKTIYPGAYSGRWPHIHFEVYESLEAATSAGSKLKTSQIALPKDACERVYTASGYEQSAGNLSQLSIDSDMVFSDGYASQLAKASGSPDGGMGLTLNVGV
jgi:protocatechuate 3,4-dioxygenase beta subunit